MPNESKQKNESWEVRFDRQFTPKLLALSRGETQWGIAAEMVYFITQELVQATQQGYEKGLNEVRETFLKAKASWEKAATEQAREDTLREVEEIVDEIQFEHEGVMVLYPDEIKAALRKE